MIMLSIKEIIFNETLDSLGIGDIPEQPVNMKIDSNFTISGGQKSGSAFMNNKIKCVPMERIDYGIQYNFNPPEITIPKAQKVYLKNLLLSENGANKVLALLED